MSPCHQMVFFLNIFENMECKLLIHFVPISGDKNISILHSPCRTSDLQFSLVLQTHALVLKKCIGGGGG